MYGNKNIKTDKEEIRIEKTDVLKKFKELRESKKLDLFAIRELLDHCNTIQEIINYYLNLLKDIHDPQYVQEKIYYYKIISPELSKSHGIQKISEKERFYQVINIFLSNANFNEYAKNEVLKYSEELRFFYEIEEKKLNGPNLDEKKAELNIQYSRWDNIYNSDISFKDIYNEEYFFYILTNCLIRDTLEGKLSLPKRKNAVRFFIDLFKFIDPYKSKYPDFFEFACYALLCGQMNDNYNRNPTFNDEYFMMVTKSIINECNHQFLDLEEIKKCLNSLNAKYTISGNSITIKNNNFDYIIDNYKNYNLSNSVIIELLKENVLYQKYLLLNKKFNKYIDKQSFFDGLLNKIILNFSKSKLALTSIKKIFAINEHEYKQLFKEIKTEEILKYIYYLPYNNKFDTERTLKIFLKIIIDPFKDLIDSSISTIILSTNLYDNLKKFVNLVQRKYKFGHELHHLVTVLLFFLYKNNRRRINSLPKELENNKVKILSEKEYKEKKNNSNVFKEAGNLFEFFIYGKVNTGFYLKELLFIANEKNDELDCEQYKIEYEKCHNKTIDEMLNEFPTDQIFSKLILEIKEGFKEEKTLNKNFGKSAEEILGNNLISKIEDNIELFSIEKLENMIITIPDYPYNNHLYEKKSYYEH